MFFDYHDEPPGLWPQLFESLRAEGTRLLRTHVLWGAHEQVRGIRDFSKSSRLRLERYLRLAHSFELSVELIIGFPPLREAFPAWAYGQAKKSTIPSGLWEVGDTSYAQCSIPSLHDPDVREAFFDFVAEVNTILGLYRQPEGPVSGIYLDLELYEHDFSVNESPDFSLFLERRYPQLVQLNSVYHSSFRDYAAPTSINGLRVLGERRPWVAAYDYRWCRREMLREVRRRTPELKPPPVFSGGGGLRKWQLAMDAVLFEAMGARCFPFVMGGHLNSSSIGAFRVGEYLAERAAEAGVEITWLGLEPDGAPLEAERVLIVCGKYMSRVSWDALARHAALGAKIDFLTGVPRYDEALHSLPKIDEVTPIPVDDELWNRIEARVGGRC